MWSPTTSIIYWKTYQKVTGIYQFSILFFRNVFLNPSFFFHCYLSDKKSARGKCGFLKEKQNICYMRDTLLFVLNNYVEKMLNTVRYQIFAMRQSWHFIVCFVKLFGKISRSLETLGGTHKARFKGSNSQDAFEFTG